MGMRRVHFSMRTEGIKAFSKRIWRCSVDSKIDTKMISVDANLFENGTKQLRFRLKNRLVWTGPLFAPLIFAGLPNHPSLLTMFIYYN